MLIAVERLLLKIRQPASRAGELVALRRRLRDERAASADDDERTLAARVNAHKLALAAELAAVRSCRSCAAKQPAPVGRFDGGACCAGETAELFDDRELAALALAGTRPRDLVAPRSDHAGCAFRGETGCTLAVTHRPARCVHYLCETLRAELHRRGRLDEVEAKQLALNGEMQRFGAAREARLDRELMAPFVEAVAAATRRSRVRSGP